MAVLKAGPEPWAGLAAFLEPFAALLRRLENRHAMGAARHLSATGWLVGERPVKGRRGGLKRCFAWGLDEIGLQMIELAHSRWVVERFYQDARDGLGLDDYAGRS